MPGLFGCVKIDFSGEIGGLVQKMANVCSYHPSRVLWNEEELESKGCVVRRWRRNISGPAPFLNSIDGISIGVDGWILSVYNKPLKNAEEAGVALLEAYRSRGVNFIEGIEGEFNLFLFDKRERRVIVANDRFGLRPLFYSFTDSLFAFGFEGKQVVAALWNKAELDLDYARNYLSYGRVILGDYTFYKNVKVLPPATLLLLESDRKPETRQYWRIEYRNQQPDALFFDKLASTFNDAMQKRIFSGLRYGLTLSGGLDSRMVASALAGQTGHTSKAISFGLLESDEVRYARMVADRLSLPHALIPLEPGDFLKSARYGSRFSEAHDLFVQSYGIKVFNTVKDDVDVVTSGLALDLTLGGSYLDVSCFSENVLVDDLATNWLEKKACYFSDELLRKLFKKDYQAVLCQVRTALKGLVSKNRQEKCADTLDAVSLYSRVNRVIFFRQGWQRLYVEDTTPTFDYAFMNMLLSIPAKERYQHKSYMEFMKWVSPNTLDIPYQRTNLPAIVPPMYWAEAAKVEEQRESLYDRINQQTGLNIRYPRYSTNYGDWLKFDIGWKNFVDQVLFSKSSMIYDKCRIDREVVRTLVDEHRNGTRDHRQRLLQILSLELSLEENLN